jgi:hypothetical protein
MAALAAPARAVDFPVSTTADSGAGSLRAAITSANGNAGPDSISFALAGCPCVITLATSLVVTDALTITGPGASMLAVDGGGAVRVMQTTAAVAISDLTIRNGLSTAGGGGISANAPLTLTRVTVQNNSAHSGGGVQALQAATVVDSVFDGNTVTGTTDDDGGGLQAYGTLTVTGSRFVNNRTTAPAKFYGGGGGLIAFGPTTISSTTFIGNTSNDWGGGAYIADFSMPRSPAVLTDVQFVNNRAQGGGGGGLFMWFEAVLSGVDFTDDFASYRGGGAYGGYSDNYVFTVNGGQVLRNSGEAGGGIYSDADLVIDGTEFVGNTARNGNGGAAFTARSATVSNVSASFNVVLMGGNSGGIDTAASLTMTNSTLSDNQTLTGSGGGSGAGVDATVTNCRYLRNSAGDDGGGLIAYGTARVSGSTFEDNTTGDAGGGIATTHAEITGTQIARNASPNGVGGGAYANMTATVTDTVFLENSAASGGGLAILGGDAQVTGGRFEGNQASAGQSEGGGIYSGGPTLTVAGADFLRNSTNGYGGGISANATAISGARFIANQAGIGGAVHQNGGGTIVNCLFARNDALAGVGEALSLAGGSPSIRHATIAGPALGSAIWVDGATAAVLNSIITSHGYGLERNAGSVMADHNLFQGNLADTQGASITNTHALSGDPRFVDPAMDDYHLQPGSAALDAGPGIGVDTDADGDARPQGGGFDLGWDELLPVPTTTTTLPQPAEICGNCIDDDQNGLTDFEDPACCATSETAAMTVKRVSMAKRKKGMTFSLAATLARTGVATGSTPTQDVFVQILQAGHDVLCARVPAANLTRKKSTLRFRDRRHAIASASGLDRLVLKTKRDGRGVLTAGGRGMSGDVPAAGSVRITIGLRDPATAEAGNRCSTAQAQLAADQHGAVRAP